MLFCVRAEESVRIKDLSFSEREVSDADGPLASYRSGDKAQFLSFQSSAKGVCLPMEESTRILSELHSLASRCAVVHNIHPRPPTNLEQSKTMQGESLSADSNVN